MASHGPSQVLGRGRQTAHSYEMPAGCKPSLVPTQGREPTLCAPNHSICLSSAPLNSARPRTPAQPTARTSSWGSQRGAVAWLRPGSSAYPVLSLQSLLTTALGTWLAPSCSRPGQWIGRPVLWGQLWSQLFPLGAGKQMLHAARLHQQLACLHLWAPGEGPQGHLCSASPSGRQRQCQALLGLPSAFRRWQDCAGRASGQ